MPCEKPVVRLIAAAIIFLAGGASAEAQQREVTIDAAAPAHPFPHFWEKMMGSGRAALSLRDGYRQDLRTVKAATDLAYVRFHAIFHDELGVYGEDGDGRPVYDFQYVDQIYDGLLDAGVRPFVELSFMPRLLAARQDLHAFWYHPVVSPPRDAMAWERLIEAFTRHLVDRYGIDEVAQWYFEVWNEPNLDFWTGNPAQKTYFDLYDHTAAAVKRVNPRLRIGGPATAQAAWVDAMIAHAAKTHVPLDFVSTHFYGTDVPVAGDNPPPYGAVCGAVRQARRQIDASALPHLPLVLSEFNATFNAGDAVLISPFMAAWLAKTIRDCDGLADMMSFWTFSDVFEEQGVIRSPFAGGFGLIGLDGIPKPAFAGFAALHRLGDQRLDAASDHLLVTRRPDGTLVVAAWNGPDAHSSAPLDLALDFRNVEPGGTVRLHRVDEDHGDARGLYRRMGSPTYPTREQIVALRQAGLPGPPETLTLSGSRLELRLPPNGLAVIELAPKQ